MYSRHLHKHSNAIIPVLVSYLVKGEKLHSTKSSSHSLNWSSRCKDKASIRILDLRIESSTLAKVNKIGHWVLAIIISPNNETGEMGSEKNSNINPNKIICSNYYFCDHLLQLQIQVVKCFFIFSA